MMAQADLGRLLPRLQTPLQSVGAEKLPQRRAGGRIFPGPLDHQRADLPA